MKTKPYTVKPILTCIFTLFSLLSFSQTIHIKDSESRKVIPNVYAYSGCNTGMSDENGILDISNFCEDSTIILQHASYIDYLINPKKFDKKLPTTIYMVNDIFNLNEVVVSASKWNEGNREISKVIQKIKNKEIALYNPQTSADILSINSKVFVQKSQLGGGSPMIRGFSANKVLLVMDGVRMNNAIYRSGNLQNVLNIDPNAIESTEVIFGPGSVIYGSDALGGVMSYSSYQTKFSENKFKVEPIGLLRFSSTNKEKTVSGTVRLSAPKWSSVTSVSSSSFDDLRMGAKGHSSYEKKFYVLNNSKKDSIYRNTDKNLQVGSGYKQYNILQKLEFKINKDWTIGNRFYYSELSDVPRYDRTIILEKEEPTFADWYYGPQKWLMNSLSLKSNKKTKYYNRFKTLVSYQNYQESRHKRKINNPWKSSEKEEVNMLSLNFDFFKTLNTQNTLYYGAETWYNKVNSVGTKNDIYTGVKKGKNSRYPDGSSYFSSAIYITDKHQINEKWETNAGIRYSYINARAEFNTTYQFSYKEMKTNNGALSGSVGVIYLPTHSTKISLNYASGFRSPNIDDLSKVFKFDSKSKSIIIPNIDLKPEFAHSIDFTFEMELWKKTRILFNAYYTYLDNAMIVSDFQFNGQDFINMYKVKAVVNKNYAHIYGLQTSLDWMFYKNLYFKSSINYSQGKDSEGYGVRHVPPLFGTSHLVYNNSKWISDINIKYNGQINYKNLAPSEREKTHMYDIDNQGHAYSPSWYTLNFNLSYHVMPTFTVALGIENILDKRYRPYSSGIAAPGRNFVLSIRLHSF